MRKLLLAAILIVSMPITCLAYENSIEVNLAYASGTLDYMGGYADYREGFFGLGYTRYLKPVETTDSPYGAREFLQHPSNFGVALFGDASEIDAIFSSNKIELSMGGLAVGGEFFTDSEDYATGFGITYMSMSGEREGEWFPYLIDADITVDTLALAVTQYLNRNVRLTAGYEKTSTEYEYSTGVKSEYDEVMLHLNAEALIDNFFIIGAEYGFGEEKQDDGTFKDITEKKLDAGFFLSQSTSLSMGYSTYEEKDGYERTEVSISGDSYFGDRMRVGGSYYIRKTEYENHPLWEDLTYAGVSIELGFYF